MEGLVPAKPDLNGLAGGSNLVLVRELGSCDKLLTATTLTDCSLENVNEF